MKIVTHDSSFHTDDIFAVAVLLLKFPDAEVVRSRKPEIIDSADYVVDTGMVYDPSRNRFDHHMPEGAGVRGNGIPYASFGLVWKQFGEELAGGKRGADIIDKKLIQPIDSYDNGVALSTSNFKGLREYVMYDFFLSYLTQTDTTNESIYSVFMNNVKIARDLLEREILKAKEAVRGEDTVRKYYELSEDKRLIVMDENIPNWREVLTEMLEVIYVIHPRSDGQWTLGCVPDLSKSDYGANRKSLPLEWAGKEGRELQDITGVNDAVFAHRNRFMTAAKTKEGALALAKLALDA